MDRPLGAALVGNSQCCSSDIVISMLCHFMDQRQCLEGGIGLSGRLLEFDLKI